jgi:hypothetical protein
MRVFISYSSKDGLKYAEALESILSKRGHDTYLIDHEICIGETIWDEIANEILTRRMNVFVITQSSEESKGQKQEYDLAVARYKKRFAFAEEKSWKIVEKRFPFLTPPKGISFNDKDFEDKCESISSQLVKAQDKEEQIQETKVKVEQTSFEKLDDSGLDKSEVTKCLEHLSTSYQGQTVIPEAFIVRAVEKIRDDFVSIGFNNRLPREWFLTFDETKTVYSNEFLFQEFGKDIALGERDYLVASIMKTPKVNISEEPDEPEVFLKQIKEAMSTLNKLGHKPKILFPSIPHYLTMHMIKKAHVKYSSATPTPVLRASLDIDGVELKLIEPLGQIPKETILFGEDAVTWYVKKYKDTGALYTDLGNDTLYPRKYVDAVALTTVRCEISPEGVFILKRKDSAEHQ